LVNDAFRGEMYGEDDIFTPAMLRDFMRRNDIDRDLSPTLRDEDGEPIGMLFAGRRGRRAWFGLLGIVPERRREGLGRALFAEGMRRVERAGIHSVEFEVVRRNAVAYRLYRSFGFTTVDELLVWSRSRRTSRVAFPPERTHSASAIEARVRRPATCWQREPRSVARAGKSACMACDGSYAFVRSQGEYAMVLDAGARDSISARALLRELDARVPQDLTLPNEPASSSLSGVLRAATRWKIVERQRRMLLTL
jgi:GNAT superfamily N-acetyltransferase